MTSFRTIAAAALAAGSSLALGWSTSSPAQEVVQPLGLTDADLLATQMRQLAANPRDLTALATAGELSLKLGDLSGAAALFARADKIDPRSGRVKAGMGSVLVRSERPGEALRFFDQAVAYGWAADHFAADRGFAYDLIGQGDRAQRDYRLALRGAVNDETVRRYALSLGIAGQQAAALQQLDPLLRRQDRAAWRARAFVLAMNGDTAGAAKIATTMMPAAMNQGLGAFFQRLPTLAATDRAFAVHFGEIYATPERLADARLTPALNPLSPDAGAPVQVAAITQPVRRSPAQIAPARVAPAQVAPVQAAAAPTVRMAPPRAVVQALPGATTPTPGFTATQVATVAPQAMRETDVRVAATGTASPPSVPVQTAVQATVQPLTPAPVRTVTSTPVAPVQQVAIVPTPAPVTTPPPLQVAVAPAETKAATDRADAVLARIVAGLSIPASELGVAEQRVEPAPVAIVAAVERAPVSSVGKRVVAEASAKEARDGAVRRVATARLASADTTARGRRAAAAIETAAADPAPTRTRNGRRGTAAAVEDNLTEAASAKTRKGRRVMATVAAEETAADTAPAKTRNGRRVAARTGDDAATEPTTRTRAGRTTASTDDDATRPTTRTRRGKVVAEADASPLEAKAKRAADRQALADKKTAADRKALADQAAADKKAARSNPPRIWVQVAGGANDGDLGKAWSAVKAKTPALAGKAGYATPLRATNRVLTGPFKTDAEARAFVNQLAKQGVSGFSFTSDAGQEVKKLGSK